MDDREARRIILDSFTIPPEFDLTRDPMASIHAKPWLASGKQRWTRTSLVEAVKHAVEELGWPLTIHEFLGFVGTASNTIYRHFPRGWYDLLDEAGIEPVARGMPTKWSDEELLAEYDKVHAKFGRHPTLNELDTWAGPSACTFKNRLGRKAEMERRYEDWVAADRPVEAAGDDAATADDEDG